MVCEYNCWCHCWRSQNYSSLTNSDRRCNHNITKLSAFTVSSSLHAASVQFLNLAFTSAVLPISCSYCVTPLLPFLHTWLSPMSPPSSFCLWPLSVGDFRTLRILFTIHLAGRLCAQHECVFVQRGSDGLNHRHNSDIITLSIPPSKSCRTICHVASLS